MQKEVGLIIGGYLKAQRGCADNLDRSCADCACMCWCATGKSLLHKLCNKDRDFYSIYWTQLLDRLSKKYKLKKYSVLRYDLQYPPEKPSTPSHNYKPSTWEQWAEPSSFLYMQAWAHILTLTNASTKNELTHNIHR